MVIKRFSFIPLFCFVLAFFFSGAAFAETCMTCHESAFSNSVDFESDSAVISQDNLFMGQTQPQTRDFKQSVQSDLVAKAHPYLAAKKSGAYFSYAKSDYAEETGNAVADEANLFAGVLSKAQAMPDTQHVKNVSPANIRKFVMLHSFNE